LGLGGYGTSWSFNATPGAMAHWYSPF